MRCAVLQIMIQAKFIIQNLSSVRYIYECPITTGLGATASERVFTCGSTKSGIRYPVSVPCYSDPCTFLSPYCFLSTLLYHPLSTERICSLLASFHFHITGRILLFGFACQLGRIKLTHLLAAK